MFKKLFHPVLIFVVLQVVWFLFLALWITWYIRNELRIAALTRQFGLRDISGGWLVLVGGSTLLLVILLGITFLFVYQAREARLNRLQGDFISSITHELKSPLASIQLYLETLSFRDPPPEDTREFIRLMLMDTERLSRLIDNILVASRIRRRKLILNPSNVDIFQFVKDFLETAMLKYGWDKNNITLAGEPGIMVGIDKQYMEIILTNIINNAIKYSNQNFHLDIRLKVDNNHVRLDFADKGIGLETKELKKIFKIFYRSSTVKKSGVQGTGLGLFIVRDVIRTLGGKVYASSPGPGKGLTVTLILPIGSRSGN